MRKGYTSIFKAGLFSTMMAMILLSSVTKAQTTLTTLPNPPFNATNGAGANTSITFVLENTNPFPILLTDVSTWLNTTDANSTLQLWYSATSLSGPATVATPAWTQIAQVTNFPAPAVNGITPVWNNLNFTIPPGTQYRFAVWYVSIGSHYSGTGAGTVTPSTFTGGGCNLKLGDVQIAGQNVGYGGINNPRWFTGEVKFQPAGPCTNPPTAGTVSTTATNACLGIPFTLSLTGSTGGTGQTYQWQSSPDNIVWTDITGAINPTLTTSQTVSTYYRCIVTCGVSVNTNSQLITTAAAVSGTFTINSALPTGGTNFQTFNDAYDYIKCGINGPVIFNVNGTSGPYTEQLIMNAVPGASAINTVTFNGNGRSLNFLATVNTERAVIKLNGADHIKFDNLVINALGQSTTEFGFGVQLINNADSNAITNCSININTTSTSTNYAGIVLSASATNAIGTGATLCDGNILSGNSISGGHFGITCVGSNTDANRDNVISRNNITDFHFYGIYISGNFNTQVDSNSISRPTRNIVNGVCNGIFVTALNVFVNITRNSISNPFGGIPNSTSTFNGIFITGVDALGGLENKVINNKIFGLNGDGEQNGVQINGSDNVWIQHNTILMDGSTGTGITRGFYQTILAAGVRFENNIVSITRSSSGAKYAVFHNTLASDIVSENNDLFLNSATGNQFIGFYNAVAQLTLANWQAASGDDLTSVSTNPVFTDVITGNLRPTNASIDNRGIPLGILIDITGAARSATTPDLGAYEFTPAPCTAPATPGVALVNPTTVCENSSVSLQLSGNSVGLSQTYQWQTSPTSGGPYTNLGNVLTNPDTSIISTTTLFYRVAVTCGASTVFSTPALLNVNPALPAGTYTVNQTIPTGGGNYNNFAAVKAALSCGIAGPIIFNVVPGTGPYNEQFILDSVPGTSAINTITFNGNANTIAFSSNDNIERAVIKLRGTDHIIFDSLVIDANGAGTFGFGVHLINNADSNIVRNCTVLIPTTSTSTNYAGLVISSSASSATTTGNTFCDGNAFRNNTITGGFYGVALTGGAATGTPIFNNQVTGNTILNFYSNGVYMAGNQNALIHANNLRRPTRNTVTNCFAIFVTGLNTKSIINANRISNPFGGNPTSTSAAAGVYFTGCDATLGAENIVSNNLVYDFNGEGIQYGLYNSSSDFVKYYHNTISLQDNGQTGTTATYGFFQTLQAESIDFKNNIITISRAGTGNKFGINLATTTTTFTSNNNDLFVTGTNAFVGFNGNNQATLANWQAATSQDANSVNADPIYASPATGNFRPLYPAIDNLGTPVGITDDILNAVRSATTPDLGAYEFEVPPCTAPPAGGDAVANPNSGICLGTQINLTLTNYTFGGGQTYQWEFATTLAGPWSSLGGVRLFPDTTIFASTTLYYRCLVTCSGNSTPSTPALVNVNPAFLSGFYTINPALPATLPNFQNFVSAVAALDCGITGFVTFDVAPGTYTEQVRMRNVAGTGPNSRVTFRSANGNPASVTLTYDATVAADNYVLKLDSARYITYKDMTITAINSANGRAIELASLASFDSILNCNINAPLSTATTNVLAGVYANSLRGSNNVIKNNRITGGAAGIYWAGTGTTNLTYDHVIDSNVVTQSFQYGIYVGNNGRIKVSKNEVAVSNPRAATNYGIYSTSSDSAFQYTANKVNINGVTATTSYGIFFTGCDGIDANRGIIAGNTILGLTGNTGILYGLYQTASTSNNTVNNVVSINSSGTTAYGTYLTGGGGVRFQNNSVLNTSPGTTNNAAAYFAQTSGTLPSVNIQNNIFSHEGGGRAMQATNLNFIFSNYNTLYTTGTALMQFGTVNYATLQDWINTSNWDLNSISIKPEFTSVTNLEPNLASPEVWAIHGRGTQIAGNDYDFNNNPRPTTFTTGVPDMGAYEFLPTSLPTLLTATPAAPAPGITQTFTYGTDVVAKITYDATAPVPASIGLRRYSGVLPIGLSAGQLSMYFYTQLEVPAQGAYKYKLEQTYIDPWRGFIPTEPEIRMGRTNAANVWEVSTVSTLNVDDNVITDTGLVHIGRYTGIAGDPAVNPLPPYVTVLDTSNRGTRFWVPYGHHYSFNTNGQDMWLYLSAQDSANVTVRVNGTNWRRDYAIAANTVRVSDIMPKFGLVDARITDEGLFDRGISITSDVPIVAYAHIYDGATSGASLLLPVGVYGYEYLSLNSKQFYPVGGAGSYSWFAVISDRDSTLVEITPTVVTKGGRPAGVPFTQYLMKGQVYNVMGTINGTGAGSDLSGSTIKSIANASGKCYPIAVFSGSSRTAICYTSNGDNLIQQVFPSQAWGKKYLAFATASSASNTQYNSNIFRIMVKDPTTVVTVNGVVQTTLSLPGNFYEVSTTLGNGPNGSLYIEANKPVLVAQFMVSTSANQCPGVSVSGLYGDPEMIYISPIEQGIKKAVFYNTNESSISQNYVSVIIPTAGLTSLTIDGSTTFTDVFVHPSLPGYSCVRQNFGGAAGQHIVLSDSAFTAITYGLGSVESYGYNAGTLVKNLNARPNISNTLGSGGTSEYTCVGAPFRFSILITAKPQELTWQFSNIATLNPNADVTQINPVPLDSSFINGRWYYRYNVPADYTFSQAGQFIVPIIVKDTVSIEGCENKLEVTLSVTVIDAPVADFSAVFSGCIGSPVILNGIGTTSNGIGINTWNWDFGNTTTATGQNTTVTYNTPGTYNVTLTLVALDGCLADTTKPIVVNALPPVDVVSDSIVVCGNSPVTFDVLNPDATSTYDWYTTLTGGTLVFTGPSFTVPNVTGFVEYFVGATNAAGCISERKRVVANILPNLPIPVAVVDSIGVDRIKFSWLAVPGALTYEVSTDAGTNWIIPSSGPTGLTHTVTGLNPLQTVSLIVRATGAVSCQQSVSAAVEAKTLPGQIYIPNAFSPNADGLNDFLLVYGYTIKEMRFLIFNQWGEKIFESNNQATGWDGKYKGKPQPSGVYMYVCELILNDGKKEVRKGSINLVR